MAAAAALTKASGVLDKDACNPVDALAASTNISLAVAVVPNNLAEALALLNKLLVTASVFLPCNLVRRVNFPAA